MHHYHERGGRHTFGLALVAILFWAGAVSGQTTSFSYQGRLTDGGTAANGNYDLQFTLFDSAAGGAQIGATQTVPTVAVASGIFTVQLDFGAGAFPGANRFLEISARLSGSGAFTTLSPRQQITSTPYAVRSLNASSADTISANALPAGSSNYIQNTTTTQAGANFNIGGNGVIGGDLTVSGAGNGIIFADASKQTTAGVTGSGIAGTVPLWGSTKGLTFTTLQVSSGGDVSIGFAQNQHRLNIQGGRLWTSNSWSGALALGNASAIGWNANAGGQRFGIGQSDGGLYFFRTASSPGTTGSPANYDLFIADDGKVGIGTTTPARTLDVSGRARVGFIPLEASAAAVCFNSAGDLLQCGGSSLRWKSKVRPFLGGLDIIRRLRPINFNWKESGLPDIGLGAEDVAKVALSLTFVNSKGEVEGVKYDRLNTVLINAVQEQQSQLETLHAENAALNARLLSIERIVWKRVGSARRRR